MRLLFFSSLPPALLPSWFAVLFFDKERGNIFFIEIPATLHEHEGSSAHIHHSMVKLVSFYRFFFWIRILPVLFYFLSRDGYGKQVRSETGGGNGRQEGRRRVPLKRLVHFA